MLDLLKTNNRKPFDFPKIFNLIFRDCLSQSQHQKFQIMFLSYQKFLHSKKNEPQEIKDILCFQNDSIFPLICWDLLYESIWVDGILKLFIPIWSQLKAMAPHSSTLAWEIPRTEEPGRLQSVGSLGVGHD